MKIINNIDISKYFTYQHLLLRISIITLYIIIALFLDYPILGSDEYAYYINGKYLDNLNVLHAMQTHLQSPTNFLYLKIINIFYKISGDHFVFIYRLFQVYIFLLTGQIIRYIFLKKKILDKRQANIGIIIYLLSPCSFYINTVMPEILTMLISAITLYLLMGKIDKNKLLFIGIILGISILIKSNILATVFACNIFLIADGIFTKQKFSVMVSNLATVNLITYASVVFFTYLFLNDFDFKLKYGLNLDGNGAQLAISTNTFFHKISSSLKYFLAHMVILVLIFTPFFTKLIDRKLFLWNSSSKAIIFIIFSLIFYIFMTSWFTAGAGDISDGELFRLHGRYLNPVLIYFPFLVVLAISNIDKKDAIIIASVQIIFLLIFFIFIASNYKIFPWDYPLLFSFFNSNNWYKWSYGNDNQIIFYCLIFSIFLLNLFIFIFRRKINFIKNIFLLVMVIIFISGLVQTYSWAHSHLKNLKNQLDFSRALKLILKENKPGDGVFVNSNAYGDTSFILFNLDNIPKVIIKYRDSIINQADINKAKWVLFMGQYNANFAYKSSIAYGNFTFFPLYSSLSVANNLENAYRADGKYQLFLGYDHFPSSSLRGFNTQEGWGAWTKEEVSSIILPHLLFGSLKVVISGWTIPENLHNPIIISLGSQSQKIFLSEKNKTYELYFKINTPVDILTITSHILRPKTSARNMGVALNFIEIENTADSLK